MNTTTEITPIKDWKKTDEAVPRTAVQMICIDRQGGVLLIHRSDQVRSARNCWSFPSGLHDIGETLQQSCARELEEEFGLVAAPESFVQLGVYENIDGDPECKQPWHWVVNTFAVLVDFTTITNKEPEKHDAFEYAPLDFFCNEVEKRNFHSSFKRWYLERAHSVNVVLKTLADTAFTETSVASLMHAFACEKCAGKGILSDGCNDPNPTPCSQCQGTGQIIRATSVD